MFTKIKDADGKYWLVPVDNKEVSTARLKQELDAEIGGGAGDWIKRLAKPMAGLVGKTNCSSCEARRIATNAYVQLKTKYGQIRALKIMKDLWLLSATQPDEVLVQLKGHLDA